MTLHKLMKYLLKYMKKLSESRYNPFKNIRERIIMWIFLLIFGVIIDEYIKEGYIFNPDDLLVPFTHEQIIVVLLIIGCGMLIYKCFYRDRHE